jgi:3-oxoacyl-[acyl-carrier-protein] synthase-3
MVFRGATGFYYKRPKVMSKRAASTCGSPLRKLTGVRILGTGSFLPEQVVTNEDLVSLGSDPQWLVKRTGIHERRHAPAEMATSDMAVAAARHAMEASGVLREEIDLVVLATLSPDQLMPATATLVQDQLGLQCAAMDVSAACAGFTYALVTGMQFVATGCSRRALVIGSDTNSRVLDPTDRTTYPLFGDGAGAVILAPGSQEQGALGYTLGSDGSRADFLYRSMGGSREPFHPSGENDGSWFVQMDGRAVFKWAVRLVEDSSREVLQEAELDVPQVDWWVLHQANERIIDAAIEGLGVSPEKVIKHMKHYGNTSAGSIPIALDEMVRAGKVERGQILLMSGYGAGLAWGTLAFRW